MSPVATGPEFRAQRSSAARRFKIDNRFGRVLSRSAEVPFLDTYRTMCLLPRPEFRHLLEGIRDMRLTEASRVGRASCLSD